MECLIKHVKEECITTKYKPFNELENNLGRRVAALKKGIWSYQSETKGKEEYLNHFADKLCTVNLHRTSIVLEKSEEKVSLKIFIFNKQRDKGTHFFKTKQYVHYITYNKKTNIVYVGKVVGKKSNVKSNPFYSHDITGFFSLLYDILKSKNFVGEYEIQDSNKMLMNYITTFCNDAFGTFNENEYLTKLNVQSFFIKNYVQKNKIIVPDNYEVFFTSPLTLREIKRAKNSLVLAVEKKYKIKGKKFHRVLHSIEKFNGKFLYNVVSFFGVNRLKHLTDEQLKSIFEWHTSYITNDTMTFYSDQFSEKEKDKMFMVFIDCITNDGSFSTFVDHMNFIFRLKHEYNEDIVWKSKTRDEFTTEHVFLSNLLSKHQVGIYHRVFSEDFVNSFETAFISGGGVYYPVLFTRDEQYRNESDTQHNCVRTYVKKVSCFIISLREGSKTSQERATIQIDVVGKDNKISFVRTQTLGRFNQRLESKWDEPLKMLDNHLEFIENKFNMDDYKIHKVTMRGERFFDIEINSKTQRPEPKLEIEKNEYNSLEIPF